MFRCKECSSCEFQLVLHPGFKGTVEISTNEHEDVVVSVNGQTFVADLMFINQYGVCQNCGAIRQWEYHYPKKNLTRV